MSDDKMEVLPGALYSPMEVAAILGFKRRPKSVYDIPETELVPSWVGPRRGKKMYKGSDVLAYIDAGRPQAKSKIKAA